MDFELRPAEPADHPEIGRIAAAAYIAAGLVPEGTEYDAALRDAAGRSKDAQLWVAHDTATDRLLGSVTICPPGSPMREIAAGDQELEFRMLSVDPDAQGRGVGAALVSVCLDRARSIGCRTVVLCVVDRGEPSPAQRLYRRLGFQRIPERDWKPIPEVILRAMRLDLEPTT